MRFARWVFLLAGLCGVLLVAPLYFEDRFFSDYPPPINRPEFYYGFAGVTLAWQLQFLVIAHDPRRYRMAMLPAMVEKASFVLAILLLYALQRVEAVWLSFAAVDGIWLGLFLVAFLATPKDSAGAGDGVTLHEPDHAGEAT